MGFPNGENRLGDLLAEVNGYAVGALVPIAGILFLALHYLRSVLDIILDVVNHFYFRPTTPHDREVNAEEMYDIDEVTFDGQQMYFARRDAIHRRFKRILNHYRHSIKGRPQLTIISHSQGSMVAIEVLNDKELAWLKQKFRAVNFVTMGSPFHHIYQNYFQHFYPPLDQPFWNGIVLSCRSMVKRVSRRRLCRKRISISPPPYRKPNRVNTPTMPLIVADINSIGVTDKYWMSSRNTKSVTRYPLTDRPRQSNPMDPKPPKIDGSATATNRRCRAMGSQDRWWRHGHPFQQPPFRNPGRRRPFQTVLKPV